LLLTAIRIEVREGEAVTLLGLSSLTGRRLEPQIEIPSYI